MSAVFSRKLEYPASVQNSNHLISSTAFDWSILQSPDFSGSQDMMASPNHQMQGIYCLDPFAEDRNQRFATLDNPTQPSLCSGQSPFLQAPPQPEQEEHQVVVASNDLPVSDMDLENFLEMDDRALTELTGVNCAEWNSLFNGQLDDISSPDPLTGVQNPNVQHPLTGVQNPNVQPDTTVLPVNPQPSDQPPHIDRWLVQETVKLERQQKLQQQKLLELQQTLLKTEILKNHLQIATISQAQSPMMSTTASLILSGLNSNGMQASMQASMQQGGAIQQPDIKMANPAAVFSPPEQSLPPPSATSSKRSPSSVTISSSATGRGGRMSTSSSAAQAQDSSEFFTDLSPSSFPALQSPPLSPLASDPNSPEEPCKRKVHNLIEKKYRCSINDRICMLRDMVSKHSKDNKKLQKSAVLQKTIDFIHHLQNSIRKLQDENRSLKEALAMAGKTNFNSPPNTPDALSESDVDSGHPSSPDDSDGQTSPTDSRPSFFNQMLYNPMRQTNASQYLLVVTFLAVFFINPLSFYGPGAVLPLAGQHSGSARSLSSFEMVEGSTSPISALMWVGVWVLRLFVAALCFGWMMLKSMPKVMANSNDSVQFWRLRKQAEKDLQKGEYVSARSNLEIALSVINRPIPSSYLGMTTGLVWSFFSHLLFQLLIGRVAVYLASLFIRRKAEKDGTFDSPKKPVFGVTFDDVSETYHLLHQINMASSNSTQLLGMGYFLALNALNFAEADRPFNRLKEQQVAEMYFAIGIQCYYSMPHGSSLPMWYYFFCFRNTSPGKYATPLKWAVTEPGKAFLMSGKWASDVAIGSRLYAGNAALPSFSVTRAYCKELLCETFGFLLLPDGSPDSGKVERDSETALQAFKLILNIAKEANSCLLNEEAGGEKTIKGAEGCSDSGFTVIQWWASVGIVSCYWLAGKESMAEDFYPYIESPSGEMGAAVPSALQLAFKANRMYKRPSTATKVPLQVVVQLCATTSNSLEGSVANLLQDHSNSTETELHQLGLLQACDWLLSLKVALWENHEQEEKISKDICPGFYQDLDTLSKLVSMLPSARSRLHLYKGCYQLIAGASPIAAQAMLNSTGSASMIRRRKNSKESEGSPMYSQEHAMAKRVAFKHLPPSMESCHTPLSPSNRMGFAPLTTVPSEQTHV